MTDNLQRYGFRPYKGMHSSRETIEEWPVASGYQASASSVNVPLRVGDPVSRVNDGTVALTAAGSSTKCYGVVVGIVQIYDSAIGAPRPSNLVPGGTTWTGLVNQTKVLVMPAKGAYFEIDCDDATTATTEATYQGYRGENADIAYSGVVNVGAFPRLDISTHATTNSLQLNIVDISRTKDNRYFDGNYVKLVVQFNLLDDNQGAAQLTGV